MILAMYNCKWNLSRQPRHRKRHCLPLFHKTARSRQTQWIRAVASWCHRMYCTMQQYYRKRLVKRILFPTRYQLGTTYDYDEKTVFPWRHHSNTTEILPIDLVASNYNTRLSYWIMSHTIQSGRPWMRVLCSGRRRVVVETTMMIGNTIATWFCSIILFFAGTKIDEIFY